MAGSGCGPGKPLRYAGGNVQIFSGSIFALTLRDDGEHAASALYVSLALFSLLPVPGFTLHARRRLIYGKQRGGTYQYEHSYDFIRGKKPVDKTTTASYSNSIWRRFPESSRSAGKSRPFGAYRQICHCRRFLFRVPVTKLQEQDSALCSSQSAYLTVSIP
ncbi:hypothetical protein B0T17DRAFT_506174 [Bombardia bombarda]|uniref:Uncharacterized protein n=1 Tax=Bombardia bombarda TaxID=252184 RepID=A0AA40C951_9PEZI|nr:hypothetical protein B0T17DRAFT_506174 [Bombardia bombarda]